MGDPNFESDESYKYLAVSREDKIAFTSKPFDTKKNRWVPDAEDGECFVKSLILNCINLGEELFSSWDPSLQ